ncbi:hypothetical protein psal_cds_492 [Pandoravirus salinus]|uniref:Uncharacterized protein n=1 Tax=Pandoravirus salinus TaxID=1349410 RepID=S4VV75_9VIRU|nr:hypothetical protein psal_cds_492 [Pandoravirus salinus]AGO84278.1 hypothetical protein psal_cds_492 [Pandoravirus salinus]
MSASDYPGAEQDAQRLIDQFDSLMLDGGQRPQDARADELARDRAGDYRVDRDDDDDDGDFGRERERIAAYDDARERDIDRFGRGDGDNDGNDDEFLDGMDDVDDLDRVGLYDDEDREDEDEEYGTKQDRDAERVDRTRGVAIVGRDSDRIARRDGRPVVVREPTEQRARVIGVARGVVDDGEALLVIDEHRLAAGGTGAYTNLNGAPYRTADLVAYLYAEEPADKSVPHTQQRLTQAQVNGLLALLAAGHAHVVAPADVDHAAYALSCPLPAGGLPAEAAATIDAHLEQALIDDERAIDVAAYHTAALVHYAVEIAMAIGWDYKPAVNFAVARYISVAGTPLLAEEGGLLPDEIPRRRRPHRHPEAAAAAVTERLWQRRGHDARSDLMCLGDDDDDGESSSYVADHGENLFDGRDDDGDRANDDGDDDDGEIILPAETRDEAVARHRALADRRRRHPPMGMDLELVAAVLQAEAEDGLARTPANLDEMRRRLRAAVGARLKPSKADRKIDRYAVPWAYGVCCALDRRDVDEVLGSPQGAAAVRERAARAWTAETLTGGGSTAATSTARKPPRPLAPYLSDAEYAQRLARLEPALLAALSRVIPLEARGRSHLDAGDYVIHESNLALGAPLSPPMGHSLAQKIMRFRRQAGTTARACDLAPKPPAIVFVRDCPQAPQ